jgi:hypothetical protein
MRCMTCPGGQSPNAFAELKGITPLKSASTKVILLIELLLASDASATEGSLVPFWKLGQSEKHIRTKGSKLRAECETSRTTQAAINNTTTAAARATVGCRGEKLAAVDRERIFFSLFVRPPCKNKGWRKSRYVAEHGYIVCRFAAEAGRGVAPAPRLDVCRRWRDQKISQSSILAFGAKATALRSYQS